MTETAEREAAPRAWLHVTAAPREAVAKSNRTFGEIAADNPCFSCRSVPCCSHLSLARIATTTWSDFDRARYYLNFRDLEIVAHRSGTWQLALRRPCTRLDPATLRCTVRGTDEHPRVCKAYNPFHCWYKSTFSERGERDYVRLDRARLDLALALYRFDGYGGITRTPAFAEIRSAVADREGVEDTADPVRAEPNPAEARAWSWSGTESPCSSCTAACCTRVFIERGLPRTFGDVDSFRYMLGFPGVELALDDRGIVVVVRTTCVHFEPIGKRCGLIGRPERPKQCEFLDEWRCSVRERFVVHPERFAWLRSPHDAAIWQSQIDFDGAGSIRGLPRVERLKAGIAEARPS